MLSPLNPRLEGLFGRFKRVLVAELNMGQLRSVLRDKFLVDKLDDMPRAEKDLAIERLDPSLRSRLRMPPSLFRTVTDDERQAMIDELRK